MFSLIVRAIVVCMLICAIARAQAVYDFVSEGENTTIATLVLEALSSDPSKVSLLQFTDEGQDIFGLGEVYAGTFDVMSEPDDFGRLIPDVDLAGRAGLGGEAAGSMSRLIQVTDLDPPPSALLDAARTESFFFVAVDNTNNDIVPDGMSLWYYTTEEATPESFRSISVNGQWLLVPEPTLSPGVLLNAAIGVCLLLRKRFFRCDRGHNKM